MNENEKIEEVGEAILLGPPGVPPAERYYTEEEIRAMPRETVRARLFDILKSLGRK